MVRVAPVSTLVAVSVKFPALAVLLMVRVLLVIGGGAQQAHAGRPRDAQRAAQHGAGAAPATAPVAVSAAQEMAPEASTPVVNTSVQFTSLRSSWSQPTCPAR